MKRTFLCLSVAISVMTGEAGALELPEVGPSHEPERPDPQPAPEQPVEVPCAGACEDESPEALFARAGEALSGAKGTPDFTRAAELLQRACDAGFVRACGNLGVLHHEGKGVPQDEDKATLLFKRACDGDHAPACFNLGLSAETRDLDNVQADLLFRKACKLRYDRACARVARSVMSSREPETRAAEAGSALPACHLFAHDPWPEDCWTPRTGIVSGGFVGFDASLVVLHKAPARRISAGEGYSLNGRLGIELWDQLLFTLSFGVLRPKDRAPISELVVTCHEFQGITTDCGGEHELDSVLKGGYASYELGYQYRFRLLKRWSIAPAVLVGYMNLFNGLRREVECKGCPGGKPLPISLDGAYVTGLLRMTFGQAGFWSIMTRSQWFLNGDTRHITSFGVELFAP